MRIHESITCRSTRVFVQKSITCDKENRKKKHLKRLIIFCIFKGQLRDLKLLEIEYLKNAKHC